MTPVERLLDAARAVTRGRGPVTPAHLEELGNAVTAMDEVARAWFPCVFECNGHLYSNESAAYEVEDKLGLPVTKRPVYSWPGEEQE